MKNIVDIEALCKIQYGMYVVSASADNLHNGQIVTTVMQVTNQPNQVMVCLSKETLTHELVEKSKSFGVSLLEQSTPFKFIGRFGFRSGKTFTKFSDDIDYVIGTNGNPLLRTHALINIEVSVNKTLDVGTHTIFVGEVKYANTVKEGIALTYEYYHTVLKGKSPENAPTFQIKEQKCS